MPALAASLFPEQTTLEFVPVGQAQSLALRSAAAHWMSLCGTRRFPPRQALNPSRIPSLLRDLALIRVIEGGADYEYRVVGDSVARAFRVDLHNRRVSDIAKESPALAAKLAHVYRRAVESREGFVLRGIVGHEARVASFVRLECLILPMGAGDDAVDHLLTFMVWDAV